jgi:phosphoesterase RecJ-like protein
MNAILGLIRDSKRVLISSHENPDGDAIGSMLALGLGIEQMGKEAVFYNKDGVPEILRFLPHSDRIVKSLDEIEGTFDLVFAVDCTGTNRAGREFEDFLRSGRGGKVIIMDHHQTNNSSADFRLLDPCSSSTGMIIYSVLKQLPVEITSDIADNIYYYNRRYRFFQVLQHQPGHVPYCGSSSMGRTRRKYQVLLKANP